MAQAHAASPCWANLRADHQATITMQTSSPSNHHHANIITKQPSPCKHQHQATITMQTSSPSNHHHEQGHYTYYRKPLPIKVFSQYLKTPNPEKTDTKPPRKVNPQGSFGFRVLGLAFRFYKYRNLEGQYKGSSAFFIGFMASLLWSWRV